MKNSFLRRVKAVVPSLILPGLGQMCNGEWVKGAFLFVCFATAVPLFSYLAVLAPKGYLYLTVFAGVAVALGAFVVSIVDAYRRAGRGSAAKRPSPLLYILIPVIGYGAVLYPLSAHTRSHVLEAFAVPSLSMRPGLEKGDLFFVSKQVNTPGADRSVRRGDVVVFIAPNDRTRYYVKRIVGLPGDMISINGTTLSVNGIVITTSDPKQGVAGELSTTEQTDALGTYEVLWRKRDAQFDAWVPSGHVFVLGDNRNECIDSRSFGPVPLRDVVGIAKQVWYNRVSGLKRTGVWLDPNG